MTRVLAFVRAQLAVTSRLAAWLGWRPAHYALIGLLHEHFIKSGAKAGGHDWRIVFYPWADALRLSILKYHEFPWWNPWSVTGQPLFADPQTSVFMPETLFVLAFGSVAGLKLALFFYFCVGYEGTRFLCRDLFGPSRFVEGVSVIPALVAPLALHFNEGHVVLVTFYLFPWLLALSLTWQRSIRRSLGFGFVIGCLLLSYIHYVTIISATVVAPIVLLRLLRDGRSVRIWAKAALVGCTALGMGFARLGLTMSLVSRFPRVETTPHYPFSSTLGVLAGALVQPFQDRYSDLTVGSLHVWELGCYVGVCALLLAWEGFRRNERRFWPLYASAILFFVLAWNNRDPPYPSYWLHFIPPWSFMLIIPRWRLFGCYFLLLGAVHGLVGMRKRGQGPLAGVIGAFVAMDLGLQIAHAYKGTFFTDAPPFTFAPDPPATVNDQQDDTWANLRANRVSMAAESTLLGYFAPRPLRSHLGDPSYAGEFYGSSPVSVESWTPNRVVLLGKPGSTVTLNVNPSNYWLMNGVALFPAYRPIETQKPFSVVVPRDGRMEFVARPPHWQAFFLAQGGFVIAAALVFLGISRTRGTASHRARPARSFETLVQLPGRQR